MLFIVVEGDGKSPLRKCDMYGSKRKSNKRIRSLKKIFLYLQEDHLVRNTLDLSS